MESRKGLQCSGNQRAPGFLSAAGESCCVSFSSHLRKGAGAAQPPKVVVFPTLGPGYPAVLVLCPCEDGVGLSCFGHPSKHLWQVQTIRDGKGINPGLEGNSSSLGLFRHQVLLWVQQVSCQPHGAGDARPACLPEGAAPQQKELAGEAECLLFNPQFPSWHTLPISVLLPFPGNLQSEQLKPAGITNWCLEATFAGDVY